MENTIGIELSENDVPEVGPNDIVVHLVNPYKCGICEEEYLERPLFLKHMLLHLKGLKEEHPTSQLTMTVSLTAEMARGITITRDILQLGPDGSIKQVKKLPKNVKPHQVKPLRELEEAGVIKLDLDVQDENLEGNVGSDHHQTQEQLPIVITQESTPQNDSNLQQTSGKHGVLQDSSLDENQTTADVDSRAALIANDDGTFRFSLKAIKVEKQHLEIVPISPMEVEMEVIKKNTAKRTPEPKSKVLKKKTYECEICGKHLSCSTSLNRHRQYHKAEKPYVCEVCNKGFKDSSNLKKHTLIHKRKFGCHMCNRSFLHKSHLEAHLRHHQCRSTFIKNGDSTEEVIVKTVLETNGTHVELVSLKCLEKVSSESQDQSLSTTPVLLTDNSCVDESKVSSIEKDAHSGGMSKCGPAPGDIVRLYRCGHCGKETIQRGNVMRHLFHHLKKKPNEVSQQQFGNRGKHVDEPETEISKTKKQSSITSSAAIQGCTFKKRKAFSNKVFLSRHTRQHLRDKKTRYLLQRYRRTHVQTQKKHSSKKTKKKSDRKEQERNWKPAPLLQLKLPIQLQRHLLHLIF
ncbi:zinc finger protein 205 [Elysia marginata]|uniref:Zinc finger protein 205 n=1 Tax=Elysia marginata TaxID=1093978 RepID=A0AAV4HWM5_9GAST|nr:zinc finger protein 205 [Elysia marginata]